MTTDTVNLPPLPEPDVKQILWTRDSEHPTLVSAHSDEALRSYALLAVQEERAEKEAMKVAWATQLQAAGVLESQANTIVDETCSRIAFAIRSQQP